MCEVSTCCVSPKQVKSSSPESVGSACDFLMGLWAGGVDLIRQCQELGTDVGEGEHWVVSLWGFSLPCSQARFLEWFGLEETIQIIEFQSLHARPSTRPERSSGHTMKFHTMKFLTSIRPLPLPHFSHLTEPITKSSCFIIIRSVFFLPPKVLVASWEHKARLFRG